MQNRTHADNETLHETLDLHVPWLFEGQKHSDRKTSLIAVI